MIERMLTAVSRSQKYLEEINKRPEYKDRTMLLVIRRSDGTAYANIFADKDGIKLVTKPEKVRATVEVYCPYNIMLDLFDRKYDVDYALAKGWLVMQSNTKEGWFYHYAIIRHFMKALVEAV